MPIRWNGQGVFSDRFTQLWSPTWASTGSLCRL